MKNSYLMVLGVVLFSFQGAVVQAEVLDDFVSADESTQIQAVGGTYAEDEVDFAAFTDEENKETKKTEGAGKIEME